MIFGELKAKSYAKGSGGWELLELFKANPGVTLPKEHFQAFPGIPVALETRRAEAMLIKHPQALS